MNQRPPCGATAGQARLGRRQPRLKQTALALALAAAGLAHAQTAPAAKADDDAKNQLETVVVTGTTSLKRTVRESSVAVTVADRDKLDRKAPRSTASALELVPGIIVEDSGGEASNNFAVRGLPGGGQQFIQILEDGLPVFYTRALADTVLKQELMIERMEVVRGGSSGILTANGAGATVNFLTFRNSGEMEGQARVTVSDFGTKRFDLRYGGDIGGGWYAGGGGFFRSSGNVRDTQFTSDEGGIARLYVGKKFDGGSDFSVSLKLVNDRNTFLLPIPLQNLANPEGIPGLSATTGTLLGRDNATMTVRTGAANGFTSQTNDAQNEGIQTKSYALGYQFSTPLADGLTLRARGRYTDFKNDFNSVFSFSNEGLVPALTRLNRNPAVPVAQQRGDVNAMLARFANACGAGGCVAGLQRVNDGRIFSTAADLNAMNGNGLVAENVTARNQRYVEELTNDVSATWTTQNNSLTVGWLAFKTKVTKDQNVGATAFLSDVRNNANRMDIVALDANGAIKGYLTDKSVLQYGAWGEGGGASEATSHSLYVNDEFKVNDAWRVDGGIRYEKRDFTGHPRLGASDTRIPGALDANGNDVDNIMANNNFGGQYSGNNGLNKGKFSENSYTLGTNYLLNDFVALYGRFASSYEANNENPVTRIDFTELGMRFRAKGFQASVAYFNTQYDKFRGFSRVVGTDTTATTASSDIEVNGVEFDLEYRPMRSLTFNLIGVWQKHDLKITSVDGPSADAYRAELSAFSGNLPERTPKVNYTLITTYKLPGNVGEVSASYAYMGKRFADLANSVALPAYRTLAVSGRYQISPKVSLNASVQNLTNEVGLTEGNPRGGRSAFEEATGSNYFFARPILGRNATLSLTFDL
jgi:iron complex outermembrane recepter protein